MDLSPECGELIAESVWAAVVDRVHDILGSTPRAVPAVRKLDARDDAVDERPARGEGPAVIRMVRDRRLVWSARTARPRRVGVVLRRGCRWVATDQLRSGRGHQHRVLGETEVVRLRESRSQTGAATESGGEPIRGGIDGDRARRRACDHPPAGRRAFVLLLPKNSCRCEAPASPGDMIGSSRSECENVHRVTDTPRGETPTLGHLAASPRAPTQGSARLVLRHTSRSASRSAPPNDLR